MQLLEGTPGSADILLDSSDTFHHMELTRSKVERILGADLVLLLGIDEPSFLSKEKISEMRGGSDAGIMFLADYLANELIVLDVCHQHGHGTEEHEGDEHGHEDHDEHGHEEHDEHGHEEHGMEKAAKQLCIDPHFWLSPAIARKILHALADELASIDSANSSIYRDNLNKALGNMDILEARVNKLMQEQPAQPAVVLHDAYAYFSQDFALQNLLVVPTADVHTGSLSGVRIVEIRKWLEDGVSCIVYGSQEEKQGKSKLFSEYEGVKHVVADPLGLFASPAKADSYSLIVEKVARALLRCEG